MSTPLIEHGTVRSGAFTLRYSVEGTGAPAIVIGSAVYYPRTFSANLRRQLRLVFVDHRGFALPAGDVDASEYALDVILDDIERVRAQLGLDRVIIVGHSGHGYMALEYAKKYPQRVSHVVMIATGPSHDSGHAQLTEQHWQNAVCPERKARLERDLALLPAELEAAPDRRFITFCIRMGARSWYDPTFDATPLWDGVQVNMPAIDHLWGEAFRDLDVTRGLDTLDRPVLLCAGRHDYLVAPFYAWEPYRRQFRDLTLRVFERSSHTPQLEESVLFDAELSSWLASRPVASAG